MHGRPVTHSAVMLVVWVLWACTAGDARPQRPDASEADPGNTPSETDLGNTPQIEAGLPAQTEVADLSVSCAVEGNDSVGAMLEPTGLVALRCGTGTACHGQGATLATDYITQEDLAIRLLDAEPVGSCKDSGQLIIDTADAENSLFLRKLDPEPPCGTPMPLVGALSEQERACLQSFVEQVVDWAGEREGQD